MRSGELSLAQQVALLPSEEQEEVLQGVDPAQLKWDPKFWLRPTQLRPIVESDWQLCAFIAGRGSGKLLAVSTPVPTPSGWTTMGDLRAGDMVLDEYGNPCRVLVAHPVEVPDVAYRLTFSDGTWIDACGDHQWVTFTHRERKQYLRHGGGTDFPENWPAYRQPLWDRWGNETGEIGPQIRTTQQIVDTFWHSARQDRNHCIPLAGPLELPEQHLPIDPWLLGYWIGNGHSGSGELTTGSKDGDFDADHVSSVLGSSGWSFSRRDYPDAGQSRFGVFGLRSVLRSQGLLGHKRVPDQYLRASVEQRLALLRGLMDSDGYGDPAKSTVEFCSMDADIALAVLELVRTLSERPVLATGRAMLDGVDFGTKYRVTWRPSKFNPFSLPRKASAIHDSGSQGLRLRHRMIVSYERLDDPPEMRCITVDSPNSMYLCGEGMIPTHNTRTISEWVRHKAEQMPGSRGALVARTAADARDVIVNGESGILEVSPPEVRPEYEPSKRLLTWPNGTTALLFSSEAPDQLRGPQFHWSVADELAAWKWLPDDSGLNAWDNLRLATRLGTNPQIFAGTTPKRTPFMRQLLKAAEEEEHVLLLRGRTSDNAGNLARSYLDTIYGLYDGTALARQELDGEMLDDLEGALWSEADIEPYRITDLPSIKRPLVVIGVDPTVSEKPGDETGIVVVAADGAIRELHDRHAYVLEDVTLQAPPSIWAQVVADTARRWGAPVVAETNQGGALIKSVLTGVDPSIRILTVHSRYGKALRAEPVTLAYQQGRAHHVGYFPELESQMCLVAGTLIETSRGHVPIEDVRAGDEVWTRDGFAPLIWSGKTGEATELSSVFYDGGCVVSTPCHPVFHPSTARFVDAQNVQRGDLLAVRHSPANMVPPLHGADCGGDECGPGIIGTRDVEVFFTEPSGSRTLVRSRKNTSYTTSTTVQATTDWRIWLSSLERSTRRSIQRSEHTLQRSILPLDVQMLPSLGSGGSRSQSSAGCAGTPSFLQECEQQSAVTQTVVDTRKTDSLGSLMLATVTRTENVRVSATPVYNLTVAPGHLPEFYANGVLVHNCSWVPDETRRSPDRIDALVHAATALLVSPPEGMLGGTLRAVSPASRRRLPQAPRPSAIPSHAIRRARVL